MEVILKEITFIAQKSSVYDHPTNVPNEMLQCT